MRKRTLLLPVLAVALAATTASPAQARVTPSAFSSSSATPLYFSAALSGGNEIGAPGDPDGSAKSLVEIEGDRVTFAFTWKGMPAPTMGHIHVGGTGVNGAVKVPLFSSALPETAIGTAGVVAVQDAALVAAITSHPGDFYLNLHTTEFPAGAVRGQLSPARRDRAALDLLPGLPLQTLMDGGQEAPVAGDPDGHGIAMVRASGHRIKYTVAWAGVGRPTMSHIHAGALGASGPVVVPLFSGAMPDHIFAITGVVRDLDKSLVTSIRHTPRDYYVNVHTAEFPGGAIRGQLYPAGHIGD
ncbi:MAG TPA: CHRD domain-containing protein [Kineosporiaceae bacterium]|nr:CHRD domain-containing protein [Kineosporiaceae bacterium]